jgi:hypothetical protein
VTPIDPQALPRGMAQGYQLQAAAQANQMNAMQLAEAQRQEQERGTLAQAFRGALVTDPTTGQTRVDMPRAFSEAYRTTSDPLTVFKAQQGYEKQQAASAKDVLEARKTQLDMLEKQTGYVSQVANGVLAAVDAGADPQAAYERGIAQVQAMGLPIQGLPPTFDRNVVMQFAATGQKYHEAIQAKQKVVDQQLRERDLALQTRTENRLQRAEGRAETKAQREEREAAGGLYPYVTDSTRNAAINQAMQEAGLPRGSEPPPAVLQRADDLVISGGVKKAAATGREAAEIARTDKPLEGEAAKAVAELTTLQQMTDDVTDLFQPGYTGQWEGRWGAVKQWAGNASQREVVFRRIVQDMKDQLLRARSGAAITQSEYERLSQIVPNVTDADETFQAKLLGFRRALDQAKQSRLDTATTGRGPLRAQQPGVTPLPGAGGAGGARGSTPRPYADIPVDKLNQHQLDEVDAWIEQQQKGTK